MRRKSVISDSVLKNLKVSVTFSLVMQIQLIWLEYQKQPKCGIIIIGFKQIRTFVIRKQNKIVKSNSICILYLFHSSINLIHFREKIIFSLSSYVKAVDIDHWNAGWKSETIYIRMDLLIGIHYWFHVFSLEMKYLRLARWLPFSRYDVYPFIPNDVLSLRQAITKVHRQAFSNPNYTSRRR